MFRLLSAGLPSLLLCPCMDLVILKYLQKHEKIITTACQHTNALLILGFTKSWEFAWMNVDGTYLRIVIFFFSIYLHTYWHFNEIIMFRTVICCPNKIWNLKDNGISTVLPSDVKILFPNEHLSEFLLEWVLVACILMQEHSQGRFLNCRNPVSSVLPTESILSVGPCLNTCKRFSCLHEPLE